MARLERGPDPGPGGLAAHDEACLPGRLEEFGIGARAVERDVGTGAQAGEREPRGVLVGRGGGGLARGGSRVRGERLGTLRSCAQAPEGLEGPGQRGGACEFRELERARVEGWQCGAHGGQDAPRCMSLSRVDTGEAQEGL